MATTLVAEGSKWPAMFLHNLHMLLRACWRKYPMGILLITTILLHVVGWALMFWKGSR